MLANRRPRNICRRRRMDRFASFGPLDKTISAYFAPIGQIFSTDTCSMVSGRITFFGEQNRMAPVFTNTDFRVIFFDTPGV